MRPSADASHPHNSPEYHSGLLCITENCKELAGTWWSSFWCMKCNDNRLNKVSKNLESMLKDMDDGL